MRDILKHVVREDSLEYIMLHYPSLRQLATANERELTLIPGIGKSKAREIRAVFDLSQLLLKSPPDRFVIRRPDDVFEYAKYISIYEEEHMIALYLDVRNKVITESTVSKGTIGATLVHPREFFAKAIRVKANSVIAVHNHPSGDTTPSGEDIKITDRLKECGELLGINLVDHIIIGANQFTSMKSEGLL